jgi:hypothetical protein
MAEAMKLAFDWVAGDLPTWEKGQSGAMENQLGM